MVARCGDSTDLSLDPLPDPGRRRVPQPVERCVIESTDARQPRAARSSTIASRLEADASVEAVLGVAPGDGEDDVRHRDRVDDRGADSARPVFRQSSVDAMRAALSAGRRT